MCLILLANHVDPRYPLLLAANRDELYDRPAAPASFWDEAPQVLAGRDLLRGGTWLGISRDGRVAALANLRGTSAAQVTDPPSRGSLTADFLLGGEPPELYLEKLRRRGAEYEGFQLIFGDRSGLYSYSNGTGSATRIPSGIHGFSNHAAPSPRTVYALASLTRAVREGGVSEEKLLALLADETVPSRPPRPEGEQDADGASPIFVKGGSFGTRCSTVLIIGGDDEASFAERTFSATGSPLTVRVQFKMSHPAGDE